MFHSGYLKTHRPSKKPASSRVCDETSPASPASPANTVLAVVLGPRGDLLLVRPFDAARSLGLGATLRGFSTRARVREVKIELDESAAATTQREMSARLGLMDCDDDLFDQRVQQHRAARW